MATTDQPTLADRLRLQGIQPVSDPTPIAKPREFSKAMQGKPRNAGYWAEKRRGEQHLEKAA